MFTLLRVGAWRDSDGLKPQEHGAARQQEDLLLGVL